MTEVRLLQLSKAKLPIDVTELGIMTETRLVHSRKAFFSDTYHGTGNGDRGQVEAAPECPTSNTCHGIGNGDGGEAVAVIESIVTNTYHGCGDGDRGEVDTVLEG